jgi:hypothetical protein
VVAIVGILTLLSMLIQESVLKSGRGGVREI